MSNPKGLPLGESIRFGWRTLKANPLFVIGVALATWGIPTVIDVCANMVLKKDSQQFAIGIISTIVGCTLMLGMFRIYLRYRDGETPVLEDLISKLQRFWVLFGALFVASIAVAMGLVLLVVPGIIMLLRLMFLGFVIVDEQVGPIDALQRSWDITRGYTMDLFLFFILLVGINLLGAACLGVGLLVSVPVSYLAMAFMYRELKPRTEAQPAPVPAPAPAPVA